MPKMDGLVCAGKIMEHDPDTKILTMAGYDLDESSGISEEKKRLLRGYLIKPIDMKKLSTQLSQLFQ